jgi:hypothetical protein
MPAPEDMTAEDMAAEMAVEDMAAAGAEATSPARQPAQSALVTPSAA